MVFRAAIVEMTRWLATKLDTVPPDLEERVFVAFSAGRGLVMISRLIPELAPDDQALIAHMVRVARAVVGV